MNRNEYVIKHIVTKLSNSGRSCFVDHHGHVQYVCDGRMFRYNIQNHIITKEVQRPSANIKQPKSWITLKSYNFKNLTVEV